MARIQEIHIYQHDLPVNGPPYKMALSELTQLDTTLVEIITEDGFSGFGEVCPLGDTYQPAHAKGARAALEVIAPHLIGMNPIETQLLAIKMDDALSGHAYAKAALDIALWDLKGKILGLRLCDLLGGATQAKVPSYYAIGIDSPDNVARLVVEKQNRGFKRLQLKIGGRDIEEDIAVIRKAFEARKDNTRMVLDANRSLSTRDALTLSQSCRDLNFTFEQPCDSFEEIKSLKGKLCHPIALDECATDVAMVMRGINEGVADSFGIKLTRVGGISNMITIRDLCFASRRPITCDDSWGGDIVAAACVHLGASVRPHLLDGVWIAESYIKGNYDKENPICVKGGFIKVPKGNGLGINPDKSNWKSMLAFN